MRISSHYSSLLAAILLIFAAGLLTLIATEKVVPEVVQVMALIAGATFSTGLALLLSQAGQPRTAPLVQINFNVPQIRKKLNEIIDVEFSDVVEESIWVDGEKYADDDLVVALAKVRIDIERQLRRLATTAGFVSGNRSIPLHRLIDLLVQNDMLPSVAGRAIEDILPICNRAIHGEQISNTDARNVIDIAREIIVVLEGSRIKMAAL